MINWVATGALAMYLLHMQPDLKQYYYSYSRQLYDNSLPMHYLSIILLMITVAIVAIPIDKLREWIFNKLYCIVVSFKKRILD